jgi:hypothetical protein
MKKALLIYDSYFIPKLEIPICDFIKINALSKTQKPTPILTPKSYKTQVSKQDNILWSTHIPIPPKIAKHFLDAKVKRVICTIDDDFSFQCAILSQGDGSHFIILSKNKMKELDLMVGTEINVTLEKDESEYGMPMPEEFEELLLMDPEATECFHKLTMGKQRSLLYLIGKPKRSETRIKKAVVVAEYLKSTGGKLDFKELNVAFKEAN